MGFINTLISPGAAVLDAITGGNDPISQTISNTESAISGEGQEERLNYLTGYQQYLQGLVNPILEQYTQSSETTTVPQTDIQRAITEARQGRTTTATSGINAINSGITAIQTGQQGAEAATSIGLKNIQTLLGTSRDDLEAFKQDAIARGDTASADLVGLISQAKADTEGTIQKTTNAVGQTVNDFVSSGLGDANSYEATLRQDANDFERVGRADVDLFEQAALEDLTALAAENIADITAAEQANLAGLSTAQKGVESVRLKKAKTTALSILGPLGLADDTGALKAVATGLGNVVKEIEAVFAPLRAGIRTGAAAARSAERSATTGASSDIRLAGLGARTQVGATALGAKEQAGGTALAAREGVRQAGATTLAGAQLNLGTAELSANLGLTDLEATQKQDIRNQVNSLLQFATQSGLQIDGIEATAIENAVARIVQARQIATTQQLDTITQQLDIGAQDLSFRLQFLSLLETVNLRSQTNMAAVIGALTGQASDVASLLGQAATPEEQGLASILGIINAGAQAVGATVGA